ncbi:MAG: hypothetical protein ACD_31C00002G0007 [uncultured bacterium]|uniref:Glycosyl transferase family 1 domain-containing protein n=3 Tax=Candidatus Daviesiibacteriota TaxID=1752718 RepID=A0A1F5K762_9BACT|nr:MAG: hypothetical protein ACD_31C00002G0007 [uncultured bacterium]KKQ15633.1 MAG: Mannosyltransferase [Candidatus Daviesbacteria bacterium GW2011_GWA1_36_8]OGE17505.1 MAG: hypothetical protein A2858_01200 [Candidatus Daviesbacteria bacterium RIFCSPHIGHO2_01_FULL_36_37]OGE36600.1 MAG: hypothetical protein A3E66_03045 [Candidatus Daviesbacteria bacterium RIFCSPHIGHO2_12_FULL_37_16]
MSEIFVDIRPMQLLDRKQRGIGKYTQLLLRDLKAGNPKLNFFSLPIKFENVIEKYSPDNRIHLFIRKLQFLMWLASNSLINMIVPQGVLFHSVDQLFIPKTDRFKRIVTVHDLIPTVYPKEYLNNLNPYFRRTYLESIKQLPKVEHIIAVSNYTKKDIIKYFSIDENKISVIYEAADPIYRVHRPHHCLENLKNKFMLSEDFILFVGGIDPRKNLKTVVEVFSEISKENRNLNLVITGSDIMVDEDPSKRKIDKLIKKYKLKEKILPLGFIDTNDLACLYNRAKMLIYPSNYEGFGLPVLEAMACGCPVISSNRTSIPEIAGNGAIFIDPDNIEEIKIAVKRLLNDKLLSNSLRKRGLSRAKLFSWKKTRRETFQVYKRFL